MKGLSQKNTSSLFAYGTLCAPVVINKVIGRVPYGTKATIKGYSCYQVNGCLFPGVRASGLESETPGILYEGITPNEFSLLDEYEDDFYERVSVQVFSEEDLGYCFAQIYIIPEPHWHVLSSRHWDLDEFCAEHVELFLSERF